MMNSVLGEKICHVWGLLQGDPLSPFLFLLVMEVLSALIRRVDDWSLFSPLGVRAIPFKASFYPDDLIMFLSSVPQVLQLIKEISRVFHGSSGLGYNM
jgi:hypothetical protein